MLPEDMPLKLSHNIGEALQVSIESLTFVERVRRETVTVAWKGAHECRENCTLCSIVPLVFPIKAFVHVDFEWLHAPEHTSAP